MDGGSSAEVPVLAADVLCLNYVVASMHNNTKHIQIRMIGVIELTVIMRLIGMMMSIHIYTYMYICTPTFNDGCRRRLVFFVSVLPVPLFLDWIYINMHPYTHA